MLKYSIKLGDNDIQQDKMVWSERYLSPDLSFVNGVTKTNYHLEKYKKLPVSNGETSNSTVLVNSNNVTRQGYAIIKNKEYEVQSGSIIDYSVESSGVTIDYDYLFINGKYYYPYDGKFVIDNWLTEHFSSYTNDNGEMVFKPYITEDEKKIPYNGGNVSADTIVWIEDGIVTIDGYEYIFDKDIQIDSLKKGGLKYYEDGDCLDYSAITKCSDIVLKPFESINDYFDVTKFTLRKENDKIGEAFERISFCTSYYYVEYKEHYYPVIESANTSGNYDFLCRIPKNVISATSDENYKEFFLHYEIDGDSESEINDATFSGHGVHDLHDLYKVTSFIKIDDSRFYVNRDIMNSNEGRQIAVYLDDEQNTINVGDKLVFSDEDSVESIQDVYSGDSGGSFVIYNSQRYKVINNLCDKAVINNHEYSIDYINGKVVGNDCLVLIGDEEVPMKIENGNKLSRYGNIVVEASGASSAVSYDINSYSGIKVDGKKYIVNQNDTSSYVILDKSNQFTFVVSEIKGNSMLICDLDINMTDFNDEFRTFIAEESCRYVVEHQDTIQLQVKNKIFGDKEITQELAFQASTTPISSDDYYDLLDNLEIYTKNAYIGLSMMLTAQQGNNLLQDDLVQDQFFRVEKEKAINPIIDMEKEVYYPKFISNKWITDDTDKKKHQYSGSSTDFITLEELRFNLHFRTRNLDSWKVNDGHNNVATSGDADNWFVTDFHPYREILGGSSSPDKEKLMNSSDLLGLLDFTNDDVYYQKKKISKSFLRLSFYDSTDLETQNLLATSTIFMDEHRLLKRFIDNSRKYVSEFGLCAEPNKENGIISNKISVNSEYLGTKKKAKPSEYIDNFKGVILDDDHRLGSEFIVTNKYQTESSSEGFYIYMFKEYSEKLHPKPIYMKVEFNHASIGRTIPFIVPMKWATRFGDESGNKYPERALKLTDSTDVETLKKGIKLGDVYAQSYIPLYAVYDFKNKQYAYVFDDRYAKTSIIGDKEGVVLNLYEMKIMEENETSEEIQKAITYKRQETAIIDFNKNMFPREANEQT